MRSVPGPVGHRLIYISTYCGMYGAIPCCLCGDPPVGTGSSPENLEREIIPTVGTPAALGGIASLSPPHNINRPVVQRGALPDLLGGRDLKRRLPRPEEKSAAPGTCRRGDSWLDPGERGAPTALWSLGESRSIGRRVSSKHLCVCFSASIHR